jgi:hypothetical protein
MNLTNRRFIADPKIGPVAQPDRLHCSQLRISGGSGEPTMITHPHVRPCADPAANVSLYFLKKIGG